ncbi:ABC transporter permease [Paenibacillus arenilitoris]|uniref:Transport permease protein n=1 Tax=Paenibacillus arenilitoris TaxID=2772299 RepID=A0A927CQ07_9BACL|nr:ABC transporter permease [Paenibacillus arenilitoris]MBD2870967.1 ABC transporter permease [Paenibacillus arenilitoris]
MSESTNGSKLLRILSVSARPARPNALHAVATFTWRSMRHTVSQLPYMAIDVLIFPVIFLLIFTYMFGGAISGSTGHYLQFLLPGMLVYTVTTMTVYIGIAIKTDIDKGVFNRFRTLPFWQPAAIIGTMLVNLLSYAAALATTIGIGLLLGFRPEAGLTGALLALLLVILYAFSVSWIFACIGVVVKKTESITSMTYIVLYPLMFTSNVFTDTSTMPDWLGRIVAYNPISLASTAARGLMHGTATAQDLIAALGGMILLTLAFAPLTFRLYLKKAKQ